MAKMKAGIKAVIAFMVIACGVVLFTNWSADNERWQQRFGAVEQHYPLLLLRLRLPHFLQQPQATSYTAEICSKRSAG